MPCSGGMSSPGKYTRGTGIPVRAPKGAGWWRRMLSWLKRQLAHYRAT